MVTFVKQQTRLSNQQGFTLLELIVTIIIIGILAVTILPRFSGSDGYEEYAYRARAISILRNVQLRAMQQGDTGCYQVLVDNKNLGIPDVSPCTPAASFSGSFGESDDFSRTKELKIESNHEVVFGLQGSAASSFVIMFDSLGRPSSAPENDCQLGTFGGCVIEITGVETLTITIEEEGYIHAS